MGVKDGGAKGEKAVGGMGSWNDSFQTFREGPAGVAKGKKVEEESKKQEDEQDGPPQEGEPLETEQTRLYVMNLSY